MALPRFLPLGNTARAALARPHLHHPAVLGGNNAKTTILGPASMHKQPRILVIARRALHLTHLGAADLLRVPCHALHQLADNRGLEALALRQLMVEPTPQSSFS